MCIRDSSNGDGVDKNVTIAGNVAPGRIIVSGTDFIFTGDGSITGDTTLNLLDGASLTTVSYTHLDVYKRQYFLHERDEHQGKFPHIGECGDVYKRQSNILG